MKQNQRQDTTHTFAGACSGEAALPLAVLAAAGEGAGCRVGEEVCGGGEGVGAGLESRAGVCA